MNTKEEQVEESNLSGGEQAALSKGFDVLTSSQLAAMYLAAKATISRSEDTRGRGDTFLTRNAKKMAETDRLNFDQLPLVRLADVLDVKPRTVNYTVSKFKLLLQGNREGTYSNCLYAKVVNAFDEFQKMVPSEVYALASEAIDVNADFSRSEQYLDEVAKQAKIYHENLVKRNKIIGSSAVSLFNALKDKMEEKKAVEKTISKIAEEKGLTIEAARKIIKNYVKNDRFLFNKF
jgi:hypothetical protein